MNERDLGNLLAIILEWSIVVTVILTAVMMIK